VLATTEVFEDGAMRTIVWKQKAGGRRPPAVDHGIDVRIDLEQGVARRIDHDRGRFGVVLGDDDEETVPCRRDHGGHWDAEGLWHGEPGSIVVSNDRFLAQLQRIANSAG
jgi:hypothetical protein